MPDPTQNSPRLRIRLFVAVALACCLVVPTGCTSISNAGKSMKRGVSNMNPWKKKDTRPVTGVTERRSRHKKEEPDGWFSWMKPKPKPQPPATISEWLNQDRPDVGSAGR